VKIDRIHVENFRSLRNIDIYPNDLCVFVGENNAGKSNILQALNLVLGESWPTVKSLGETDFFDNNMNNPLLIDIHFKENDENIERIFFSAGLDDDHLKAELKMNYSSSLTEYYVKKEIREQFGILHIKAIRDLQYHLGQSSWTLMGKIGRLLNEEFYSEVSQSDKTEVKRLYSDIKAQLSIHKFKQLELELKEALSSQLLRTEQEVRLDFQHFDPLNYYKTLQLIPKELGEIKDINQLGDGMKNMILLALFRAYAATFPGTSIIAIEEPEIYLHPQSRRSLYMLFKELSNEGTQIFYSTHSAEFIDLEYFDDICVVRKEKDVDELYSTSVKQVNMNSFVSKRSMETGLNNITEGSIRRFLKNISVSETNKAFFSRFIILVEGNTEKWALPIYAKELGFDFDKQSIEVVAVRGKSQIETFYTIYNEFNFPIYVIFDGDKNKQKTEDKNLNRKLTRLLKGEETDWPETEIAGKYAIFEDNFEAEFRDALPFYDKLEHIARRLYGLTKDRHKEIVARYVAESLNTTEVPDFIKGIISKIEETWSGHYAI
jgi:putative ATP-dependent endonuclease of OLD family